MNKAVLQKRRRELDKKAASVHPGVQIVLRAVDTSSKVRAVIATEHPVERYDESTNQVVREVLLMSGAEIRGGKDRLPIVDSHDDQTVRNIYGSIQNIRIDRQSGEMFGNPAFASDAEAKTIELRLSEGHITDFSITAIPLETVYIKPGSAYTTERGEQIDGPALIHTRWQAINASICATGADPYSTVRRSYTDLKQKKERSMDEALLSQLSSVGLPEGMTDPNAVIAFLIGKLQSDASEESSEEPMPVASEPVESMVAEEVAMPMKEEVQKMDETVKEEVARALAADRKRRQEIINDCTLARLERSFADQLCDSGVSADEARKEILKRTATKSIERSEFTVIDGQDQRYLSGENVTVTESADDKFADAMSAGLIQRAFAAAKLRAKAPSAPGSEEFAKLNLRRMAALCVQRMGIRTDRLSEVEVARIAMGSHGVASRYRIQRDAYHTTGSFPQLMLDAANKTLRNAYEEAPYSWSLWARQAPSVDDFKNINRIAFGESPNLEMVPETKPYPQKSMSDLKTSYKVEKYGAMFSVSWETVVNDDLDAISRVPAMHGNAARRTQNKAVYDVLFANPTMADGVALFSASHASGRTINSAGAAAPSVTTLNEGFRFMALQKGQASDVILNLTPRYLIVPQNYAATAMELVNSQSYAQSNGNEGVVNIYGVNGMRPLTVIADALLDGNSTTAWYLAADSSQIDTVEITFLSGEESPVLENEVDFDTDCYRYKVRQTFGCAAIDWRGLYRNS